MLIPFFISDKNLIKFGILGLIKNVYFHHTCIKKSSLHDYFILITKWDIIHCNASLASTSPLTSSLSICFCTLAGSVAIGSLRSVSTVFSGVGSHSKTRSLALLYTVCLSTKSCSRSKCWAEVNFRRSKRSFRSVSFVLMALVLWFSEKLRTKSRGRTPLRKSASACRYTY